MEYVPASRRSPPTMIGPVAVSSVASLAPVRHSSPQGTRYSPSDGSPKISRSRT